MILYDISAGRGVSRSQEIIHLSSRNKVTRVDVKVNIGLIPDTIPSITQATVVDCLLHQILLVL